MVKSIILLAIVLVSVEGSSIKRDSGPPGWGPPPSTTTPGWAPPVTEAPTTPGWSPPPPPPSGWSSPPSPPNNVSIYLSGELAAVGSGWAAENHAENVHVTGADGIQAELLTVATGESILSQDGAILQVTNVDEDSASSVNAVSVSQVAVADEQLTVSASGSEILVDQNGNAGATGGGDSAAAGITDLDINID